jgi:hypothetical protein
VHFVPQAPQLSLSATVLMHMPLQDTSPMLGHWHMPFMQFAPIGQAVPHVPQFISSVCVSTQLLPQTLPPSAQLHLPALQVSGAAQAIPHMPQLLLSLCVSTHWVPHTVSPVPPSSGHLHAPPMQVVGSLHALPQMPQFLESTLTSTQAPLQTIFAASLHAHLPFVHLVWEGQAFMQPPQ